MNYLRTKCNCGVVIHLLRLTEKTNALFFIRYRYEGGNGIKRNEEGFLKDPTSKNPIQVIQGSYSYPGPNGKVINKSSLMNYSIHVWTNSAFLFDFHSAVFVHFCDSGIDGSLIKK